MIKTRLIKINRHLSIDITLGGIVKLVEINGKEVPDDYDPNNGLISFLNKDETEFVERDHFLFKIENDDRSFLLCKVNHYQAEYDRNGKYVAQVDSGLSYWSFSDCVHNDPKDETREEFDVVEWWTTVSFFQAYFHFLYWYSKGLINDDKHIQSESKEIAKMSCFKAIEELSIEVSKTSVQ